MVAFEVDGWRELFTVSDRTTIDRLPSVSQDGGLLSFGGYRDGTVWLYLLRGSMRSFMLKGHPEDVITEEFSSIFCLATCHWYQTLRTWPRALHFAHNITSLIFLYLLHFKFHCISSSLLTSTSFIYPIKFMVLHYPYRLYLSLSTCS